jgi:hypothetical protein
VVVLRLFGELFCTFWTSDDDFAFPARDSEAVLTVGAFYEFMCSPMFQITEKAFYFCAYRPPVADKYVIFPSPLEYIAGEQPENHHSKYKV